MPSNAERKRAPLFQLLGSLPTVLLCLPVCCLIFMIASRALVPSVYATTIVMTVLGGILMPALGACGQNSKRVSIGCFAAAIAMLLLATFTRLSGY